MPAALLIAAAGCDSTLTTEPVDRVPAEQVIVDASTARAALVGAYDALQSLDYYGRTFEVLGDLSADNAEHVGTFQYLGQVDRNQLQADNTAVTNTWIAIYDAIARVNLILQKVPNVPGLTDPQKNQILGEAHFLRALHYHNLVEVLGRRAHAARAARQSGGGGRADAHAESGRVHADPAGPDAGRAAHDDG